MYCKVHTLNCQKGQCRNRYLEDTGTDPLLHCTQSWSNSACRTDRCRCRLPRTYFGKILRDLGRRQTIHQGSSRLSHSSRSYCRTQCRYSKRFAECILPSPYIGSRRRCWGRCRSTLSRTRTLTLLLLCHY